VEPFVEETPESLFTEPNFPVEEPHVPLSEEVEYPVHEDAQGLHQQEVEEGVAAEEDPVVQEDATPTVEETPKVDAPSKSTMPLRATRRFQTVGNPAFKVIGVRPKKPSRFVTVGKEEYKTIKASITSITDIYKASPEAKEENDQEVQEPLNEEEEEKEGNEGSHAHGEDDSHPQEREESSPASIANEHGKAEHSEDNVPSANAAVEDDEEFHTAIDDSEAAAIEGNGVVTAETTDKVTSGIAAEVAPKESTDVHSPPKEAASAVHADGDRDPGPDL